MKLFIILALVAAASSAPQNLQDVQILRHDTNNDGLGAYNFNWELSDGSKHEAQGELKNQGTDNQALSVRGQYSWIAPDGVTYTVTYVADENGYQPTINKGVGTEFSSYIASIIG